MQGKKFIFIPLIIMALAIILPFQKVTLASSEGMIIGDIVNVRNAPSVKGTIVGKLQQGQIVTIIGIENEAWTKISYKNSEAFVNSQFLQVLPPTKEEVVEVEPEKEKEAPDKETLASSSEGKIIGDIVNVRSAPSVKGTIVGKLQQGQSVPIIGIENEAWTKISYKNSEAFVSSQFLQVLPPKIEEVVEVEPGKEVPNKETTAKEALEKETQNQQPVTVEVIVNENKLALPFELPNENNSLLVPFRLISEAIGIRVDWVPETKQVIAMDQGKKVVFTIGQEETLVDEETIIVNPSPKIVSSTTVIPLRFFAETFGANVNWLQETRTVDITRQLQKTPVSGVTSSYRVVSNTNILNLRNGPSTDDSIQVKLYQGDQLHVSSFEKEWLQVSNGFISGYVHSAYVKLFNGEEEVRLFGSPFFTENGERLQLTWFNYGGVKTSYERSEGNQLIFHTDATEVIPLNIEHQYIKSIHYEALETGTKITVELTADYHTNISHTTDRFSIIIGPNGLQGRKIVVDAGHGGKDPGAVGNNLFEKEIVLDVSLRLQRLLESAGVEVLMLRGDDRFLELHERVAFANNNFVDSFISIHANAAHNSAANGTETFWNSLYNGPNSLLLAQKVHTHLIEKLGTNDRGVKEGNFHVIRETTMPSVLVELGFITNEEDAKRLATDQFRQNAAEAIFQGIHDFYSPDK